MAEPRHYSSWMESRLPAFGLLLVLILSGCSRKPVSKPLASGKPYEVLLIGDTADIVGSELRKVMPAMPQPEPYFDVRSILVSSFDEAMRLERNIVILRMGQPADGGERVAQDGGFALRLNKDVWAQNQCVLTIVATDVAELRRKLPLYADRIRCMLAVREMYRAVKTMMRQRNPAAENTILRHTGVRLTVPEWLTDSLVAPSFVWLSDGDAVRSANLAIWPVSLSAADTAAFSRRHDRMVGRYIKGETAGSGMQVVPGSVLYDRTMSEMMGMMVFRGCWQMSADGIGGPFVSVCHEGRAIEAFVLAPGRQKRNKLRQAEAVIYTVQKNFKQKTK